MYTPPFFNIGWLLPFVFLDLILKGFALWRSAKNNQPYWFIILLVVNSFGILPLIYLVLVDKQSFSSINQSWQTSPLKNQFLKLFKK